VSGLQALECKGRLGGINSNSHERVFIFTLHSVLRWQEHAGDCHECAFTLWLREQMRSQLAVLVASVMPVDDDIFVDDDDDCYVIVLGYLATFSTDECYVIAFNPERNLTSPGPYQSMLRGGRVAFQVVRHHQL